MSWYIRDKDLGLFVVEMFGVAFWTSSEGADFEEPQIWNTKEEAKAYLLSWQCYGVNQRKYKVVDLTPEQVKEIITKNIKVN